MQNKDLELLIKEAKGRNPDAFTQLMQIHMKNMYRISLAILMNDEDAGDAVQDTILACWEKMHTLKEVKYFRTWMTRILINKCYDIRKSRDMVTYVAEYKEPAVEDNYNLELKEALSALDEKYRLVMTLFYIDGYQIKDIAKILKLPRSTVQTRLQRGREKLADYYKEI